MDKRAGIVLIVASIVVTGIFVIVAMYRNLTGLENVLLQVSSLVIGLLGSFVLGRESAREAAKDLVKPHARSAFRRLVSHYGSLSRLVMAIQNARPVNNSDPVHPSVLDKLESLVIEQIATANDALEDWRDIVPEDVEELRAKLVAMRTMENKG